MARFLKAFGATSLVAVPILISETVDDFWKWQLILGFCVLLFCVNFWGVFRPDQRFENARAPMLDLLFDQKFKPFRSKLKANERLPFRVNIMQPCGVVIRPRLSIAYRYGLETSDPDYAICWPRGHGSCWHVFSTGQVGWFDRREHSPADYNVTSEEDDKTQHVVAVLSLPVRRKEDGKPIAVLNLDALNDAAADFLQQEKEELKNHRNRRFVELVSLVGILT